METFSFRGAVVCISSYLKFQFTSLQYQTDVRTFHVTKIRFGLKCGITPSEKGHRVEI